MFYTLAIIKPDAVKRSLSGKILEIIEGSGRFHIKGMKLLHMTKHAAERFYEVHKDRPFYGELTDYMSSGPSVVIALASEKEKAHEVWREMIGATDPAKAADGTIRKLFGIDLEKNSVHGSDSLENGKIEIAYFFSNMEII